MITRFAPSPTGELHMGNIRIAVFSWLFAKKNCGKFILRFDDTDVNRSNFRYLCSIKTTLDWLGLDYDIEFRQSERLYFYNRSAQFLLKKNRIYSCSRLCGGDSFMFSVHWHFRIDSDLIFWNDIIHGEMEFNVKDYFFDPIIIRGNGRFLYIFSSIVDDIDTNVTHVIRGDDHIVNTAIQIEIMKALGRSPDSIKFAHVPLLFDTDNRKLSKRFNNLFSMEVLKNDLEPVSLVYYLSKIGTSKGVFDFPFVSYEDLFSTFDLADISSSKCRFYFRDLFFLNAKFLRMFSYSSLINRLHMLDFVLSEDCWNIILYNVNKISDIVLFERILNVGGIFFSSFSFIFDENFKFLLFSLRSMSFLFGRELWWKIWIFRINVLGFYSMAKIFSSLRFFLTGSLSGPEMVLLLPFIGFNLVYFNLKSFYFFE